MATGSARSSGRSAGTRASREPAPAPRPVNHPQGVYSSLTGYRGTQTYGHTASYRPTSSCCLSRLFDRLRPSRSQSSLASTSTSDRYTAGYAPQSSCGPGWCRDTVVQYVPQIAYRTAYEPVPVTTYKTTTTINPQTGLPRTCTRPCTSYTYQASRVPYTTYRPVYTTVPVTDTLAQPTPNYAQQQALLQ